MYPGIKEAVEAANRDCKRIERTKKNMVCDVTFGSHLYGTVTPTSDKDYRGIFLPSVDDILLGRIPRASDESEGEVDSQDFSLHHFMKLACQGQTVAIDMLFAPENCVQKYSKYGHIWDLLQRNRHRFLSKKMNAFIGYARGQASKYSLKGTRYNKLQDFVAKLQDSPQDFVLASIWDNLPKDEERTNPQGLRELQIAGKWYGETTAVRTVNESASAIIQRYGERAKTAANAGGIDFKALSHAVRVSKELIDILTEGKIVFPLRYAPLLLDIKQGNRSFNEVEEILDTDLHLIEKLVASSCLPERVDTKWWDEQLKNIILEYVTSKC